MKSVFATLPDGRKAFMYTITGGGLIAHITNYGATIHRLFVPDRQGRLADVVLGFETPEAYKESATYFGATVGRNCNRVKNGCFMLNGKPVQMGINDGPNNLHSGPDFYTQRLWNVEEVTESAICMSLHSPDTDQGMPGNADIRVTYMLEPGGVLRIVYDGICDKDTVFNLTNHSCFNLAGHDHPEKAMEMLLSMPARFFTPDDETYIPTGEQRNVAGTPMDFRTPKAVGRDIGADYEALKLQNGYDHNFEVFTNPCAILSDPGSGRTMAVYTDCPGVQLYSGNFLNGQAGKDGVRYCFRGGVCLETQYFPNAMNNPQWKQPVVKAGQRYHSETKYVFK